MNTDRFRSWSATHPGAVRKHNEDSFVDRPDIGIWAVADGAGGHHAGDVASRMIAQSLETVPAGLSAGELLAQVRLRIEAVHGALIQQAEAQGPSVTMASTVVVLIASGSYFACLWAGDSRAYLLRDGRMAQITRDHSYVQELVEAGAISIEESLTHPRANVITRAVGAHMDAFELDKVTDRLHAGDRFLLCSDGLCKTLSDAALEELLGGVADGSVALTDLMVSAALDAKVNDNVTAVTVEAVGPFA